MRDRRPFFRRPSKLRAFEELENRRVLSAVSFLSHPIATLASRPQQLVSGDINADGRIDLVAFDNNKLTWFENIESVASRDFESRLIAEVELQSVQLADLDGDQDLDIVAAQQQDFGSPSVDGRIFWLENLDGRGEFSERQPIANSAWFWIGQIVATDLDEDNDMDLVVGTGGGLGGGSVAWLENDGTESFSTPKSIVDFETAIFVDVDDIDRDGDSDVLAAFGSDFPFLGLSSFQNDGNEQFTTQNVQQFNPGLNDQSFPTGVSFVDLDDDGDKDWVTGLSSFVIDQDGIPKDVYSIGWNENTDGLGQFLPREILWQSDATGWVQLVDVVDLDGDGDQDLLAAISGDLHLFENNANEFAAPRRLSDSSANQVIVTDLDGDRDLDLVGLTASGITWLEQRRVGDFTNDGAVDFADFLVMSNRFGLNDAEWEDGDLDGDKAVTFRDFLLFADEFGS